MKAKFVNENISNIIPGKSEEEVLSVMNDMDPEELLLISAANGFFDGVKTAIDRGATDLDNINNALTLTASSGSVEAVKLLLDKGADVNTNQDEALRMASYYRHEDVVKLLIDYGADAKNAMDWIVHFKYDKAEQLLKKYM